MRFSRKSSPQPAPDEVEGDAAEPEFGPRDISRLTADELAGFADLGSLLIPAREGVDLQMQVDENSGQVLALVAVGATGALEIRAFAAPREGDLWSSAHVDLAAEAVARGGVSQEVEGPFGTELLCHLPVQLEDGTVAQQASRIVGFNGPRWMLRGALLGDAATDEQARDFWLGLFGDIVVRRGTHAVPPGEPLPLSVPAQAQRVEANGG